MEFNPPYQHDLYVCYFKHQVMNHPDLAHSEAEGNQVFSVVNIEDSHTPFRTGAKPKDFMFRLYNYTYQVGKGTSGQYMKILEGGFLIAKHTPKRDASRDDVIAARASAEKVLDHIILNMLADSEAGHILFNYSLEEPQSINVIPTSLTGDGMYIGYECIFSFSNFFTNCPEENVIATAAGGPTPNELC